MQRDEVPKRLRLQLNHIRDMIKEQNRMVLAEVEPTESEREDMLILLDEIKAGAERGSRIAVMKVMGEYEEIKGELNELGYNVTSYSLAVPEAPQEPLQKSKKQVHFEDQDETDVTQLPYKDEPHESVPGDLAFERSSPPGSTHASVSPEAPMNGSQQSSVQVYDDNNLIMEDQDRRLLQIGDSVGRQRAMGEDINSELGLHNNLLEDVEAQVDRSQTRLDGLTNGVKRFNHKARECGVCSTIALLVLVLFILILL